MIQYTNYHRAANLEDAYALMQKKRNIVLGGMIWLNLGKGKYNTVIDLCDLQLQGVRETDSAFTIGAYTSLHQLETDPRLNGFFSYAFRDCLKDIEGVQLRNMATAGGTVAQRAGFSDLCTLLLALDAKVELYKGGIVDIAEYFKTDRKQKDILMNILVPKKAQSCIYMAVRNSKTDLPVLNCSAAESGGTWNFVLGARPGIGQLVRFSTEEIPAEEEARKAFAKAIADRFVFGTNLRGSAEYRKMLAEVFVTRAMAALEGDKPAANEFEGNKSAANESEGNKPAADESEGNKPAANEPAGNEFKGNKPERNKLEGNKFKEDKSEWDKSEGEK